jgi:hypothetical protein
MGAIQYLLEDRAGTVYLDVPAGRPSAATLTVKTAGGGNLPSASVIAQAATVDELTRTVQTWSASNPRFITLAAGAGTLAMDRDYVFRKANGKTETIRVIGVVSNTIEIPDELPPSLNPTASDYVDSARVSYSLTAAQLADRGLYRCEWVATVSSVVYIYETLFRVVRALPRCTATAAGLRQYEPELCSRWDQFVQRDGSWQSRVDAAWLKVLAEIEGRGEHVIDRIVDWSQAEHAVYERVLLDMAATKRPSDDWSPMDWQAVRKEAYRNALDTWLQSVRWYDDAQAGRVQTEDEAGRDLATVRVRR